MSKNNLSDSQTRKQIKQTILETITTQKPKSTQQLIELMQTKTALSSTEIKQLLIELESEDNLHFTKSAPLPSPTMHAYLFQRKQIGTGPLSHWPWQP